MSVLYQMLNIVWNYVCLVIIERWLWIVIQRPSDNVLDAKLREINEWETEAVSVLLWYGLNNLYLVTSTKMYTWSQKIEMELKVQEVLIEEFNGGTKIACMVLKGQALGQNRNKTVF